MKRIVTIAAALVAVLLPARASAANHCSSSKTHGKVTVSCTVRNVHHINIHVNSTATDNKFLWWIDCGADEPAFAAWKTVAHRYDVRIDGRSRLYAMIATKTCTITASGQLTRAGSISVRIAAA